MCSKNLTEVQNCEAKATRYRQLLKDIITYYKIRRAHVVRFLIGALLIQSLFKYVWQRGICELTCLMALYNHKIHAQIIISKPYS